MKSDHSIAVKNAAGEVEVVYAPQKYQQPFHDSEAPNLLALGTRNTGKSHVMRWDVVIRCLMFPGFKALIIRRKLTDLRKSHLLFVGGEMKRLGGGTDNIGHYRQTTMDVIFKNGSVIQFSHCESDSDLDNYLSSGWDYIGFDELSTFSLDQFLKISSAARSEPLKPYKALVRACSNTLGPGAKWMKAWFIDKVVDYGEFPDYNPDDFEMQYSTLEDNKYADVKEYTARLKNLPDHVRRAWLLGEFIVEGAYFSDFRRSDGEGKPWHVLKVPPTLKGEHLQDIPWINIYRAIDWGYFPDPAVCLWIAVLPNSQAFVFKERTWRKTLAPDVAQQIKLESKGMHIVESYCDPTMFIKTGVSPYSIGELFEQNGVPCTAAQNDRELFGYSIHQYLNTLIDGVPQLQLIEWGCPELIRTLPMLQMDKNDARKIAAGDDHWAVALAYFCMGQAPVSREPGISTIPKWMQPKRKPRNLSC